MNILFLGQRGIAAQTAGGDTDEQRVRVLALSLAGRHKVTVAAASPYFPTHLHHIGSVHIAHLPSWHPEKSGGWLYEFLGLWLLVKIQPDVVHVHGWRTPVLARLMAFLCPAATYVWTISSIPATHPLWVRWMMKFNAGVFDAITTPSRMIQYQLLVTFGVRAKYVPDGYEAPTLQDIPASTWGLRKQQYALVQAQSIETIKFVASTYLATKSRKKLVVITSLSSPALTRLKKKYPFLMFCTENTPRAVTSLIRQAAVVIAAEDTHDGNFLLQAMNAARPVVAVNYSFHQEVLGTCAQFVRQGDEAGLTESLIQVLFYPGKQLAAVKAGQTRARRHFSSERIVEEYLPLYHYPVIKRVPIDSIQRIIFKQSLA